MLAVTPSLLPYSTVQLGPPTCMQPSPNSQNSHQCKLLLT
jgi:hypothetical protein